MKLYKVGGAIRDKLLGLIPKDIDFVVVGATTEEMQKLYGEPVGKDFPVYLGKVEGYEGMVEIAMARKEKKVGDKHTDFKFEFDEDTVDAIRRTLK